MMPQKKNHPNLTKQTNKKKIQTQNWKQRKNSIRKIEEPAVIIVTIHNS